MLSTRARTSASASPETVNAEMTWSMPASERPTSAGRDPIGTVDLDQRLRSPRPARCGVDRAPYPTITPSLSRRSTRRLTAVAESPTSAPMSRERALRVFLQQRNDFAVNAVERSAELHETTGRVRLSCVQAINLGILSLVAVTGFSELGVEQAPLELDGVHPDARRRARRGASRPRVGLADRAGRRDPREPRRSSRTLIAQEIPIYGVTTGFGDSAHRQISPPKTASSQQDIIRFMGWGRGRSLRPRSPA